MAKQHEAATTLQSVQRGKAERAQMAKRSKAATTLQRYFRKQQANATVSAGSDLSRVVKTARRRFAAWAGVFDDSRGDAEALSESTFARAMRQVHEKMSSGQITALYKGYCKGTGKSSIDLRGFCAIVEAVALGSKAAAEFADISLESYEMLGAAGADDAAVKLQALERGRQARAAAGEVKCRSCGNTGKDMLGNPCSCEHGKALRMMANSDTSLLIVCYESWAKLIKEEKKKAEVVAEAAAPAPAPAPTPAPEPEAASGSWWS